MPGRTVYVERKFESDGFEPDLFSREATEKESELSDDRTSTHKVTLPSLLLTDPAAVV